MAARNAHTRTDRGDTGEPNDLINFPTGPDSAGLPAGDLVAESPWPTGVQRVVRPALTETTMLPIICEISNCAGLLVEQRYNGSIDDFTFPGFILLARNTQSSVTLASPAPLRSAAVNVALLRFLSVNNYLLR